MASHLGSGSLGTRWMGGEGPDPTGRGVGGVGVGGDSIFGIKPPSRGSCKLRCHGSLLLEARPTTAVDEFHLQRRRETASELMKRPHSAES